MARTLRMALVLLLAASILVVIPGEVDAAVPGAIGRIVFESTADDPSGEIYVRDFAGSSPTRITSNTDPDYAPKWSPDGSLIAFSRIVAGNDDLFVMHPDGSKQRNLTNGVGSINTMSGWSPDSTKILFASDRSSLRDIWVMNADGSAPQRLTVNADTEAEAAWSPDGSTIAFRRSTATSEDIWLMDADGSNQRNLTNRPRSNGSPAWSPDGTRIAFGSDFSGDMDIWVIGADGSNPTNLTNATMTVNSSPVWSPDGSKIAFRSNRDGDWDIWMMNPDGSDPAHLTNNPSTEWSMDWESVNRDPVAVDDVASVRRGEVVDVDILSNDHDPDGETLVFVDVTREPNHGIIGTAAPGVVAYIHGGLVPPPGSPNPYSDSFEYEVQDARMGTARGTVTVWIYAGFDDVPQSSVFVDDINWLADQGITKGCNPPSNTLFCPGDFVTRGQMAAFLVRTLHYTDVGGGNLFIDDDGSTFELDIDKLGTAGVTLGCNPPVNDRFCPNALVTRGQMAAFLARAFHLTNLGMEDLFVDDNGSIFESDIDKLGATGISRGCNPPVNDRFCPNDYVTREQMAAFIRRAVAYIT